MSTAQKSGKKPPQRDKNHSSKLESPVPEITPLERVVTRRVCRERAENEEQAAMFISMLLDEPKFEA